VILLTAWTHLESAVDLVKAGAADYLAKPWDDRKLLATVNNLLELAEARRELTAGATGERRRRDALARLRPARHRVCRSGQRTRWRWPARSRVRPAGAGHRPERRRQGTIAEIIQANSLVRERPLRDALNCGALPSELIEAELFGAEAGAYTGANKAREGKFEAADGGTLFLDEIGTLPLAGQVKLLRVLETGRFQRLGSNRERSVKVRIVSATNAEPAGADRRWSLPRRPVLPAQRHRTAPAAAGAAPARHPAAGPPLPARGQAPGRRRRARAAAPRLAGQRARIAQCRAARGPARAQRRVIAAADLALPPGALDAGNTGGDEPDRASIEAALERNGGVLAQAAADLGLSRQALYRRLDRLGIARN
jgi:DNA-binding NtrC family response regulator